MLAQALPLGINLSSPVTWFAIVVGLVVLALIVSTRRTATGARRGSNDAAATVRSAVRTRYADAWSTAQARFVEDPHGGCQLAQTLVTGLVAERGLGAVQPDVLEGRLRAARAVVANERASTDELRAAFIELRAVFDARLDGAAS